MTQEDRDKANAALTLMDDTIKDLIRETVIEAMMDGTFVEALLYKGIFAHRLKTEVFNDMQFRATVLSVLKDKLSTY